MMNSLLLQNKFTALPMNILMVCLGNICRSPMAEGIMNQKIRLNQLSWRVDSAGTGGWHVGETPDERAVKVMKKNGIDISQYVARQFSADDFIHFDKIYVMDSTNYLDVIRQCPHAEYKKKIDLILNITHPGMNQAVPDPYYGEMNGFDYVFRLLNEACQRIIDLHG